jgi:hypothetical protein
MAFTTTYGPQEVLVLSPDDVIVWGTVMLGDTYGTISQMTMSREWDSDEIKNGVGGLAGFISRNPKFQMNVTSRMDSDITAPGHLDRIVFPLISVTGRIITPEIKWENEGARELTLACTFWDALNLAPLYKWTGTAYTTIDAGTAL